VLARVRAGERLAPTLGSELGRIGDRQERAYVTDLSYGVLRWEIALDAALAPRLAQPERLPPRLRDVLRAGAFERLVRGTPDHAAVHAWVEVVKLGPARERGLTGLVNAVLRRVDLADAAGDAALSLPGWLADAFRALLGGDEAVAAARGMLQPEPLWLTALGHRAVEALEEDGARALPGPVPGSLAVRAPEPLASLRAFRDGLVQPQNPASLAVVHACGTTAGERVLDLCGGNAIKAAALASRGARVTSVELDPRVSDAGRRNLERLGLDVTLVVADLRSVPHLDPAPVVLLDAPCSGTGTLRGHPEIKSRVTPSAVASLARLQRQLLDTAAALTAPGGTLVFAVCALTPAEGPEQIDAFLGRHGDFAPDDADLPIPTRAVGSGRVIVPVDGLDGFFVAALRRSGS
jgi:16S rRNA (cytosine967-C5)-methyltransferase